MEVKTDEIKRRQYESVLLQAKALLHGETDMIANMANIAALLHQEFQWWWTGFYIVRNHMLVLGPFQGPVACTRISKGKGVCGTSWAQKETIIVPDVHQFPGHIACSTASNAEIVIPIFKNAEVIAVLDIDSQYYNTFDTTDQEYLEKIAALISDSSLHS